MANILGTLQHARETPAEEETTTSDTASQPHRVPKPPSSKKRSESTPKVAFSRAPAKTVGKSRNPDFEPVKVLLRKTTRKKAERKWNDATDQDFSDLVEHLLLDYLGHGS